MGATLVAAMVAGLLAVGTAFGIVTTVSNAKPDPVNKPLVVYGER